MVDYYMIIIMTNKPRGVEKNELVHQGITIALVHL